MESRRTGDWDVVYEKAERDDGTLLFPERLSKEFLLLARRRMGSYIFANQYQNEIIPTDKQVFKNEWIRYWAELPEVVHTYAFIDPAISEEDTADYTAIVVVSCAKDLNQYVRYAAHAKMNPTQIIELCFRIYDQWKPLQIGIESVAYQKSLAHFAREEMKRRQKIIPVMPIPRGTTESKEQRILSLVPRFEWGTLFLTQGMHDLELELAQFPRGKHDDILDALSSIDLIATYPTEPRRRTNEPPAPNDPKYETWYRQQLANKRDPRGQSSED